MGSRRDFLRRLVVAPAVAGLSSLAMAPLAGCEGQSENTSKAQAVTRDDPKLQRDIEIPPGIPSSKDNPKGPARRP